MGSWTQFTFFVERPKRVVTELRSKLTILDQVWVSKATRRPDGSVPVATLRSPRFSGAGTTGTRPLLDLALEPTEKAAIVGASNTTDSGDATIYRKDADGKLQKMGTANGRGGDSGYFMQKEAWEMTGIAPIYFSDPSKQSRAADPYWYHKDLFGLECRAYSNQAVARRESKLCPHCGGPIEYANDTGRFSWQYRCLEQESLAHSSAGFTTTQVYDPKQFPDPKQQCPCGGDFVTRDIGYPALTSTVYECPDCERFTSDLLSYDSEELGPITFREAPGREVTEWMRSYFDADMLL